MKDKNEFIEKIILYSKEIHFPAIREYLTENLVQARAKNLSYEEFLCDILQKEYDARTENGKLARIRIAGFPAKKYLEDLKIEDLAVDCRNKLKTLASLDFIKNGQNVILYGNPGVGYDKYFVM
ncbi:MAG: ATP-binding protein [Actinobacteria bacterium]|nr:ATP-binding protein [Actinomycetota bacterium]MCL5070391.1 ATP-binding protein [Actinomycetota bacterium]